MTAAAANGALAQAVISNNAPLRLEAVSVDGSQLQLLHNDGSSSSSSGGGSSNAESAPSAGTSSGAGDDGGGLSSGAIIGIAVGFAVGVLLLVLMAVVMARRWGCCSGRSVGAQRATRYVAVALSATVWTPGHVL